jgi:hypothetical protein
MPDTGGSDWTYQSIAKEIGITAASTLQHVCLRIPPGYYILFLGHLLHAGAECPQLEGGWRLYM